MQCRNDRLGPLANCKNFGFKFHEAEKPMDVCKLRKNMITINTGHNLTSRMRKKSSCVATFLVSKREDEVPGIPGLVWPNSDSQRSEDRNDRSTFPGSNFFFFLFTITFLASSPSFTSVQGSVLLTLASLILRSKGKWSAGYYAKIRLVSAQVFLTGILSHHVITSAHTYSCQDVICHVTQRWESSAEAGQNQYHVLWTSNIQNWEPSKLFLQVSQP